MSYTPNPSFTWNDVIRATVRRLLLLVSLLCILPAGLLTAQDVIWRTTLNNDPVNRDTARRVVPLDNGDFVVGGQSGATATINFIVYRLSSAGTVLWTRTVDSGFNSDDVNDIIADPATGDTYICGRAGSSGQQLNWYVMKINGSNGTDAWAAPYTYNQTNENDEPRALNFVQDGAVKNVVVVGMITNSGFPQGRIVKLNAATGALIWGNNTSSQLHEVVTDTSGNIFCGGETFASPNQATITKFNVSGAQQWSFTYAPSGGDFNRWNRLALDAASGDVITGGLILGTGGNNDIGVARYASSNGAQVWARRISGPFAASNDSCSSAMVDSGGDVYITGYYRATSTNADWYAARLNIADGSTVWEKTYNGNSTGNEQLDNLRVVGSTVYLAGYMTSTAPPAATAGRILRVMKLNKADGSTLLETDFLDRVGVQIVGQKALIVASNGDMIVAGDSGVTSNASEVARFGVAGGGGPVAPTVTTDTQSSVTHNSAVLGGNVTADGGASVTERGIVWGLAANPTTADNKVANGSGTGAFSATVGSLPPGTTINVRAYAINSVNTSYGANISFNTLPAVAVTSLNIANSTPTNAATVNWTLTFASAVTGVTASNFSLAGAAATGSAVGAPTTGNNITWTIPVTTGSTDGTLTLNLANATGLSAAISTSLPFAGQSYTIDKTPPTVLSVTRLTPLGQTTNLTTLTFRVTYSEPVNLNAPAASRFQVVPVGGSSIVGTVTGVTGSGNTRDVTVNLTSGTGEFRLRVID